MKLLVHQSRDFYLQALLFFSYNIEKLGGTWRQVKDVHVHVYLSLERQSTCA